MQQELDTIGPKFEQFKVDSSNKVRMLQEQLNQALQEAEQFKKLSSKC